MSLNDISAVNLAGTNTAVIRTLGTGETTAGPAIGPPIRTQKSVLLFQTEPPILLSVGLHETSGFVTEVELVGCPIRIPSLAEHDDVITEAEGIREDCGGAEVDVGVIPAGLAGRGAIEIPFGKFINRFDDLGEGLGLS